MSNLERQNIYERLVMDGFFPAQRNLLSIFKPEVFMVVNFPCFLLLLLNSISDDLFFAPFFFTGLFAKI